MNPVVTVDEMRSIDRESSVSEEVLIARSGWHVSRVAKEMLGGLYGRHVVVVAGPGNNGADGKVAAGLLRQRGAGVVVVPPGDSIPHCDLVIDAAYGTGFRGEYSAPHTDALVLAVDIPSGVNGDTGEACSGAVVADVTVTFAAYKPGHFLGSGPLHCGHIELCDIGLEVGRPRIHVVEDGDVLITNSERNTHKWQTACAVIAGSPGMLGSAHFASTSAMRAGAGMVRLGVPGIEDDDLPVSEAVSTALPRKGWQKQAIEMTERVHSLIIGPGLGRNTDTTESVRDVVASVEVPVVVDADALFALSDKEGMATLASRRHATVLTPHDGEFERFDGSRLTANRIDDVRRLAERTNSVVLLKGSTTITCAPDGQTLLSISGGPRLATAGSGDILSGIVGAFLARGIDPLFAAGYAAHVHGLASQRGHSIGLVAGDLPQLVARVLSEFNGD